ncbi:TIGR03619 family F420-dependent LLM class oxidoreductase [Micromonospora lupini]|uniref:TIGR03619 family F420-dependent LLM class oxidoreductase n=1 Tax=Micromonospora lupini TaxID=285679 RepID=UPI00340DA62C
MRIGISLPHYGAFATKEAVVEVSRAAEAMGYDSLWTGDRILAPLNPSDGYGGVPGAPMPSSFKTYFDPLTALTFAAAHTQRMRLGMSALGALWYPPVLLARTLTTLDILSGGRVDAGFGIAWMRDEYTAVNVPWKDRGGRLDETIDVLKTIWTQEIVEHHGRYFDIVPTTIEPKPLQRPHPPILLAAFAPPALERVARHADGWLPVQMPMPNLAYLWNTLKAEWDKAGREPATLRAPLRINVEPNDAPDATVKQTADYAREVFELGIDEVFIDLGQACTTLPQLLDIAGRFITVVHSG